MTADAPGLTAASPPQFPQLGGLAAGHARPVALGMPSILPARTNPHRQRTQLNWGQSAGRLQDADVVAPGDGIMAGGDVQLPVDSFGVGLDGVR
jgi:hypothetical protein